jgi:hypothetical protein
LSTASPIRLVCPDCRRENEPERIYCHDCGARLDHSTLPPKAGSAETQEDLHKRVSEMFDRRRGRTRALVLKCVKVFLAAGVAAAVVLMLLPPANLPPVRKSGTLPPQISLELEGMTQYRKPPQLRYSEEQINAYLAYVLEKKKKGLDHILLHFERAVVAFHPDSGEITVGRSIFGYPIYTSGAFAVQLQNSKLSAAPASGAIGRLPIHPALMRYAHFLFADVAGAMERERKLITRVGSLQIGDKEIAFAAK